MTEKTIICRRHDLYVILEFSMHFSSIRMSSNVFGCLRMVSTRVHIFSRAREGHIHTAEKFFESFHSQPSRLRISTYYRALANTNSHTHSTYSKKFNLKNTKTIKIKRIQGKRQNKPRLPMDK